MEICVHVVPRVLLMSQKVLSLFEVASATCSLSKLKIYLRDTPHDNLYKFLAPLINRVAAKKLEEYISQYIALYVAKLNAVAAERANAAIENKEIHIVYR